MANVTVGTVWTDIELPYTPTRGGVLIQNKSDEVMEIRVGDTDTAGFELAPKTTGGVGGSLIIADHTRGGLAMGPFQARCASGGKTLYAKEF